MFGIFLNIQGPKKTALVVILKVLVSDEVKGDGGTHTEIQPSCCMITDTVMLFFFDVHNIYLLSELDAMFGRV
jgi:hypothetical protein